MPGNAANVRVDTNRMHAAAEEASALMRTLGHSGRLMILCHLVDGEKSVNELAELTGMSQSGLSQHLARMRRENLVVASRVSQSVYYSLSSGDVRRIIETLYDVFCAS